jgi:tRNA(Ile)-lysidine synthase
VDGYLARKAEGALAGTRLALSAGRAVLDAAALAAEEPVIRAYALRGVLERMGAPLRSADFERFRALGELAGPGGRGAVALGGGLVASRRGRQVVVERAPGERRARKSPVIALKCPGRTFLGDGRCVVCNVQPHRERTFQDHLRRRAPGVEMLDADQVRGPLVCRGRAPGDAFVPLGAPGRQSVSDFLTNLKLPRTEREKVLCVRDDLGIVYLAPLRIDDRVRVTASTRRVLRVEAGGRGW